MAVDTVKLSRIARLGFAIETTTGTAATLDATSAACLVMNPKMTVDRPGIRLPYAGFGAARFLAGAAKATATWSDYMTGIGAGDGIHSDFLLACGAVNTGGVYAFTRLAGGTATIGSYMDGLLYKAAGMVGNCVFTIKPGDPILREFDFQGGFVSATDTAIPTPITDPTLVAPTCTSATITIGGATYVWDEMKLDLGNQIIMRSSETSATGIRAGLIVDRQSTLTVSPEALAVATKDWGGLFAAGTTSAFSAAFSGGVGNAFTFAATLALSKFPGMVDNGGRVCHELEFEVVNESLTITLT